MPAAPGDLTLVYRASRDTDVVFRSELERLAVRRGAEVRFVTGTRGELDGDPLSTGALTANLPDIADHEVYLCGPSGMTERTTRALRAAGVPRRHIHHESFEL
jgi:ferredoxin-NADP reductase